MASSSGQVLLSGKTSTKTTGRSSARMRRPPASTRCSSVSTSNLHHADRAAPAAGVPEQVQGRHVDLDDLFVRAEDPAVQRGGGLHPAVLVGGDVEVGLAGPVAHGGGDDVDSPGQPVQGDVPRQPFAGGGVGLEREDFGLLVARGAHVRVEAAVGPHVEDASRRPAAGAEQVGHRLLEGVPAVEPHHPGHLVAAAAAVHREAGPARQGRRDLDVDHGRDEAAFPGDLPAQPPGPEHPADDGGRDAQRAILQQSDDAAFQRISGHVGPPCAGDWDRSLRARSGEELAGRLLDPPADDLGRRSRSGSS